MTTGNEPATRQQKIASAISMHRRGIAIGLIVIVVAVVLWHLLFGQAKKDPAPAPLIVQTMTVAPKVVPEIIETSGTIISPQTVEVRPQADGVLESVRIRDGETVRRGQVLFTIDPRPLRASLAQAEATLTRDQALARDAADTATRYAALAKTGALDTKSSVTAANTLQSLRGTVASDAALVREARLSLAYTVVRAPISGRAGAIQVKLGNLVAVASTTPLVTLNVGSPLEVSFALPHVQVDAVRRAGGGLPVLALDSMSGQTLDRGLLAHSARAARDLGCDAIELHGAHGYIFDQFFSDCTNLREDRYNGPDIADQAAFAAEVVAACRAAGGEGFVIILRVSQWKVYDYDAKLAPDPDALHRWLDPLARAGVDIFHASQRRFWEPEFAGDAKNLGGWIKEVTGRPVITVGSIGMDRDLMQDFVEGISSPMLDRLKDLVAMFERGEFDLVALGRVLLADPDWLLKVERGRLDELTSYNRAIALEHYEHG